RRRLLTDGNVDTRQIAAALIDDRVERDGCLARLAVADDQLALPAADWNHGVDGFDARLDRRVHGRPQPDARGDHFDWACRHRAWQIALAIQWLAKRVYHAANQLGPHGHRRDATRAADLIAFLDRGVGPDDHDADGLFLEVQRNAHDFLLRELDQLERTD